MKPKHQRLIFIALSVVFLCVAVLLTMQAFRSNLVFFFSPSEIAQNPPAPTQLVRIGGLVETGTIHREADERMTFTVTDGNASLIVSYKGMVPALFREGQGAIAEGYLVDKEHFDAKRILTKHDEKYIPREVVDSLKKTGHWHENQTP